MRENIRAALEGGDLQRIDAWTLRPKAAPTGSTRTATPDTALATTGEQTATAGPLTAPDKPAPAAIVGITEAVRPLTTAQVADAFDGELELSAAQWRERLGDMPLWLLPARAAKGKAPNPSTWWPLEFARILLERGATFDSLNRKFLAVPALKPWLPAWQEQRRERNAFGQ